PLTTSPNRSVKPGGPLGCGGSSLALWSSLSTWSMHYTGMLALQIGIPVRYHWPTVVLSYVVGVAGSAVGLSVISAGGYRWWKLVVAANRLCGGGDSGMR